MTHWSWETGESLNFMDTHHFMVTYSLYTIDAACSQLRGKKGEILADAVPFYISYKRILLDIIIFVSLK